MNKFLKIYSIILILFGMCLPVYAESIHFNNKIYDLQSPDITKYGDVVENQYFIKGESEKSWTSKFEVSYYPEVKNSIKFANDFDKEIEADDKCVLLKFVQNKKQDIAVISYLENVEKNGRHYFVYNVCKFQEHSKKGMLALKYSKRYDFVTNNDIKNIGYEVREINNDYMEKIIIAPIPPIEEPEISK